MHHDEITADEHKRPHVSSRRETHTSESGTLLSCRRKGQQGQLLTELNVLPAYDQQSHVQRHKPLGPHADLCRSVHSCSRHNRRTETQKLCVACPRGRKGGHGHVQWRGCSEVRADHTLETAAVVLRSVVARSHRRGGCAARKGWREQGVSG